MPNYIQIKEWDDTLAVVEVKELLSNDEPMVTLTYDDGVTHTVTRAYYESIKVRECCPICGDSRDLVPVAEGHWPSCPGCLTV